MCTHAHVQVISDTSFIIEPTVFHALPLPLPLPSSVPTHLFKAGPICTRIFWSYDLHSTGSASPAAHAR